MFCTKSLSSRINALHKNEGTEQNLAQNKVFTESCTKRIFLKKKKKRILLKKFFFFYQRIHRTEQTTTNL